MFFWWHECDERIASLGYTRCSTLIAANASTEIHYPKSAWVPNSFCTEAFHPTYLWGVCLHLDTRIPTSHRDTDRKLTYLLTWKGRNGVVKACSSSADLPFASNICMGDVCVFVSLHHVQCSRLLHHRCCRCPELSPGFWLGFFVAHSETWCLSVGSSPLEVGGANTCEVEIPPTVVWLLHDGESQEQQPFGFCSLCLGSAASNSIICLSKPSHELAEHCAVLAHGCLKQSSILPF